MPSPNEAARKKIFIPGYAGTISRLQETLAGTFAKNSRDSHYLVFDGNKPAMEKCTLPSSHHFYPRMPNPRIMTGASNRTNFQLGDERDWGFKTINDVMYRNPLKLPPRRESILPEGRNSTKEQLDVAYKTSMRKVGLAGIKRMEMQIRQKIDQRTTGGSMALRKAFKFFDQDASGDVDQDEFFAAMESFGLQFTEDQVLALFGHYDDNRDGTLSYYEFVNRVLESGFQEGSSNDRAPPVLVHLSGWTKDQNKEPVEPFTVLYKSDLNEELCKMAFDKFDLNKSGEIDIRELQQLVWTMGLKMDREDINHYMYQLDKNRNGTISFDEFWSWWQQKAVDPKNKYSSGGRPVSQGSSRSLNRTKDLDLRVGDLKSVLLDSVGIGQARPVSQGSFRPMSQTVPAVAFNHRSVNHTDFVTPLLLMPPRMHGLQSHSGMHVPRPCTVPGSYAPLRETMWMSEHGRVPGDAMNPPGSRSGFVM